MFFLYRAINKDELKEFLRINKLKSFKEIKNKGKYLFNIHKNTNWVDDLGIKTWNVFNLAKNDRGCCNIVLRIFKLRKPEFQENRFENGKFFSKEDHIEPVKVLMV